MTIRDKLAVTAGVLLALANVAGCASEPSAPPSEATASVVITPSPGPDETPLPPPAVLPYPGRQWTGPSGNVTSFVLNVTSLPCFDPQIALLTMGWPFGNPSTTEAGSRQYIRDPANAHTNTTLALFDGHATLPADAKSTLMHHLDLELFISPSTADTQVYVRRGAVVELWPRVNPFIACD